MLPMALGTNRYGPRCSTSRCRKTERRHATTSNQAAAQTYEACSRLSEVQLNLLDFHGTLFNGNGGQIPFRTTPRAG